jgi:uncharacterized protein
VSSNNDQSPFHRGEQAIQNRVGVRERVEKIGNIAIRDHLPDQHREFYAQLAFVFIGALDRPGRPWASMLFGRPGFIESPDSRTLEVRTSMIDGDPLAGELAPDSSLGLLGMEYETRRRNRLSAQVIVAEPNRLSLRVVQSFGNCPQYIQARSASVLDAIDSLGQARDIHVISSFDDKASQLVTSADNFYIASHHREEAESVSGGADVSHRGGKPGFVKVLDDVTLQFPDYAGNNHFNTFGNLLLNPQAGLTFVDFEQGDIVFFSGRTEIIWEGPDVEKIPGAKRLVRFTLEQGRRVTNAVPIRWHFLSYSPRLDQLSD